MRQRDEPGIVDLIAYGLFFVLGLMVLFVVGAGIVLMIADLVYALSSDAGHMACDDPSTTFWLCDEMDRMIEGA